MSWAGRTASRRHETLAVDAARHTALVGFDPTRKHKRTNFDYFYVGAGVLVCVAVQRPSLPSGPRSSTTGRSKFMPRQYDRSC